LKKALALLRRTLAERFDGKKTEFHFFGRRSSRAAANGAKALAEKFCVTGNKRRRAAVLEIAASVAFNPLQRNDHL
jgi:hypothetical protein